MAKIKLDLSSIRSAFEDFLNSLFGEEVIVLEPGKPERRFTPEEYEEYKKKRDAGQDAEKEPLPSPTPEDQPKVRLASEVKDQEEGGGGEWEDPFSGFRTTKVPEDFRDAILNAAKKEGVNPSLLAAHYYQESKFDPNAIGQADPDDVGFAQINLRAHPEVTREQALDPNFAIPWGARNLASDIAYFDDLSRGVAAYNVGRGGANVKGPEPFGGGPKGQTYINNVARNLTYDLIKDLGLKVSPSLLEEYGL